MPKQRNMNFSGLLYASVGGTPEAYGARHVYVSVLRSVCVCLYVFHTYFSAMAKLKAKNCNASVM